MVSIGPVVRPLGHLLIVTFGVVTLVFVALRLSGDPALVIAPPQATEEDLAAVRREFGLDRPIGVQYLAFLAGLAHGELGDSLRYRRPALEVVSERLGATMQLAFAAQIVALAVAVPCGVLAAVHRDRWLDSALTMLATAGQSIPYFWLGLRAMVLVGVMLGWLPTSGRGTWAHLILPAVTLSSYSMASLTRLVRSAVIEALGADYIRTATAKGLASATVLCKHALRNALIPVVTLIGLQLGTLLSGAVIVETVFAWPGVGRLTVEAIHTRDYPVVQSGVLLMAVLFVVANQAVDLAYQWLDPRLRASR